MTIKSDKRNYRKHDDRNKKLIEKSLKECGTGRSIVIDNDNEIIAGNGVYEASQKLNIPTKIIETNGKELIVIKRTDLTTEDEKRKQLAVMDNSTSDSSTFDFELLANDFEVETLEDWGVEIENIEIDDEQNEIEEDEIPEEVETVCKRGDIWQLGNHRLMCGDSTSPEDVALLMDGNKADMVFTDPPYGVSYADKNAFLNLADKGNRIQKEIKNDHMSVSDTGDFVYKAFCNIKNNLAKYSSYYITAPQGADLLLIMMMMMGKAGIPLRHCLIWCKNNHVLGRCDYNYKHEPILFGWVEKHKFYGNGKHLFSTWEIAKPVKNDLHPTMKPVELIVNALLNSTTQWQSCLDLFGGSGSTLIACEQTNRKCYMMELDEHYCDVIIARWEQFTNQKAIKL